MEYLLGSLVLLPYTFTPRGFYPCLGQLLSIREEQALFSLLSDRFGGDGVNTFAVPNLQGAEPLPGLHYFICAQGDYPQRD